MHGENVFIIYHPDYDVKMVRLTKEQARLLYWLQNNEIISEDWNIIDSADENDIETV